MIPHAAASVPPESLQHALRVMGLAYWLLVVGVSVAALACLRYGFACLYRARLIADTPTSKLRSAAQGYVELQGCARIMAGEPIVAPLSGLSCAWYSYSVEKHGNRRNNEWGKIEEGVSDGIFHLTDGTGTCIVDPDGADVTPATKLQWRGYSPRPMFIPKQTGFWFRVFSFGDYRYTECRIDDGDPLYAIGQLVGGGEYSASTLAEETRDVLAVWKRDRGFMIQQFDSDRDGKISLEEWDKAREAAERHVVETWGERVPTTELSVLKMPPHGRPYVLAADSQERLIEAHRRKALLGIAGFFALGLVCVWLLRTRWG